MREVWRASDLREVLFVKTSRTSIPPQLRFRLTAQSGESLEATLIHVWTRECAGNHTEAPTFQNMALALFEALPVASRVALLVTDRPLMLFIIEAAHRWFDVTAAPVRITRIENGRSPNETET
jgi:hypothetical protein